ncbi:unnamed protein product [Withania somnifera]
MTITPKIFINDGNLVVHGKTILKGVPDNIILTPGSGVGLVSGAFIGTTASESRCLHVFPVGVLEDTRFMCLFRFKLWWMTQRMGTCGNDIPLETQFMLVESKESTEDENEDAPTIYTVFLPLLEGQFRAVLQGNEKNEMEICLESGDNAVETNQGLYLVYMNAGTNPFEVINQAVKSVEQHLQTFHHREKKKLPSIIDWFGWCTWDAFYTDVTAEGVEDGLKSLSEGGVRPRFLIIDDGWQQIGNEAPKDTNCVVQEGAQFANRLTGIKENEKFQTKGLKHVVEEAKKQHNVKYVYVWHALAGYWGWSTPCWSWARSLHPTAEYHAAARAIGGSPIYVSDKPGNHNFELLKKLILPDGSVLRAQLPGRPTRDCLFVDPARDGTSLLKIWNVNKCTGVVGVFNCQGAGWCKVIKKTRIHDASPGTLTTAVQTTDVDTIAQLAGPGWNGDSVAYCFRSGKMVRLGRGASLPVTLKVLEYEVFHFSPIKEVVTNIYFAPIGLLDMINSGGAIDQYEVHRQSTTATVLLKVRGCGRFGVYISQKPLKCSVDGAESIFNYNNESGLLTMNIAVPQQEMYRWNIEIQV